MPTSARRLPVKDIHRRILATVRETIREFEMIAAGDAVLVGVSGGPDSVVLLHVLLDLASEFSLKLAVAHLNHALRPEADEEAAFVSSLCESLGVKCHMAKADVNRYRRHHKLSVEEAGRQLRYALYTSIAQQQGYVKIALGHHADDNAELVLMFLLRGCGSTGFSGIPPIRDEVIIRPLIRLSRTDILSYLEAKKLPCISDLSNIDDRYLRNRIRNKLLPLLQQSYNHRIIPALNRLSGILREEDKWMEALTLDHYSEALVSVGEGRHTLSVERIRRLPLAARRRVIRKAIFEVKGDLRRITFTHVEAVLRLVESRRRYSETALPDGVSVFRSGDRIWLSIIERAGRDTRGVSARKPQESFRYRVDQMRWPVENPVVVHITEIGWRLTFTAMCVADVGPTPKTGHTVALFDIDKLVFPLILRNVQPGDRFTPLGLQGSQKVKKYFIDRKIPHEHRWKCPVLLSRGRILWLVGQRMADECKVTPETKRVLRAEVAC